MTKTGEFRPTRPDPPVAPAAWRRATTRIRRAARAASVAAVAQPPPGEGQVSHVFPSGQTGQTLPPLANRCPSAKTPCRKRSSLQSPALFELNGTRCAQKWLGAVARTAIAVSAPRPSGRPGGVRALPSLSPVMSRTRRWNVTKAHAHSPITAIRFRKPISQKMWMNSQISHATKPEALNLPISATAEPRPIVAMLP